jgi:protein-S-isoprenylcysteine O-methyltransferase Ste14
MSPWWGTLAFLAGVVAMAAVRAPHIRRSIRVGVAASHRSRGDRVLVGLVSLGFVLPLAWIATPLLTFADYGLTPAAFAGGVAALLAGLWFLHHSHTDLGTNWSNTLEIRDQHRLVTTGIYRRVRHPMYLALLLYGLGQALVLPNWIAGPSFLIPFALLVAHRVRREEAMLRATFGMEYERYRAATRRLIPGVW